MDNAGRTKPTPADRLRQIAGTLTAAATGLEEITAELRGMDDVAFMRSVCAASGGGEGGIEAMTALMDDADGLQRRVMALIEIAGPRAMAIGSIEATE